MAAEAEARRQSFPASIAIVDEDGNLLLMERYGDWTAAREHHQERPHGDGRAQRYHFAADDPISAADGIFFNG